MGKVVAVWVRRPVGGVLPIVIWSGSAATIPAGWLLCNGSGGTPDLRLCFIRGCAPEDIGTAGGADTAGDSHGHVAPLEPDIDEPVSDWEAADELGRLHNHSRDMSSEGSPPLSQPGYLPAAADHAHAVHVTTTSTGNHSHPLDGASPIVPLSMDIRPPFYALCYIKATTLQEIPVGAMAMLDGVPAALPVGYAVCDGTGGTPNMVDYFLRGASASAPWGLSGGQALLDVPGHQHAAGSIRSGPLPGDTTEGAHTHGFNFGTGPSSPFGAGPSMPEAVGTGVFHTHTHRVAGTFTQGFHGHGAGTLHLPRAVETAREISRDPTYYSLMFVIRLA